MGIMTAPWVRRAMVDKFLSMFNNEEIELASPWLIEEVRRLERARRQTAVPCGWRSP